MLHLQQRRYAIETTPDRSVAGKQRSRTDLFDAIRWRTPLTGQRGRYPQNIGNQTDSVRCVSRPFSSYGLLDD
jgi:hypothetical protein